MLKKMLAVFAATGTAVSGQAAAEQFCGAETSTALGDVRTHFKDATAVCEFDGSCHVITYASPKDTHLRNTQYFAPSHFLKMSRANAGSSYRVDFGSFRNYATTASGFELRVDRWLMLKGGDEIDTVGPVNEYRVNSSDYGQSLVTPLKRGVNFKWSYNVNGELTPRRETVSYSLWGMTAAFDWVDCMQSEQMAPRREYAVRTTIDSAL